VSAPPARPNGRYESAATHAANSYHPRRTARRRGRVAAAVLSDYHVHLRPDDPEATAERYFTPANAARYRETAAERGIEELGVAEHVHRFTQALQVWQHPFWRASAVDDLDAYCAFVREQTDLRLGIELDYVPGREDRIANLLDGRGFDYVVGSVHFVGERAVDMEGEFDLWGAGESAERVWRRYFELLAEAARSGLYDIMAHPDLVKVWGGERPAPEGDLRRYYEPAVEALLEGGVAAEVSTAGLRKPVGELYPADDFLALVADAGVPVALSSDAHVPEHLGHEYERAVETLRRHGIAQIAVFDGRERRLEALG
jgi:histidinol-phosphatase (PHP family)